MIDTLFWIAVACALYVLYKFINLLTNKVSGKYRNSCNILILSLSLFLLNNLYFRLIESSYSDRNLNQMFFAFGISSLVLFFASIIMFIVVLLKK